MMEIGDLVMLSNSEDRQGRSKVTAVTNRLIWIEAPSEVATLKTFILSDHEEVSFYFFKEKGKLFGFDTVIVERQNDPLRGQRYALKRPSDDQIERIQRRQFVRVPQMLDVAVHPHKTQFDPFTTVTLDLSAGGMMILSDQLPIQKEEEVEMTFILPTGDGISSTLDVIAELVRIDRREERYELAFQFTMIPDRSRELVLRHCYQMQMKSSRRGMNPFT